jgi:ectoine hydroxylase-related dioxygenase (phytanoyl-CoA dioxygenase family)
MSTKEPIAYEDGNTDTLSGLAADDFVGVSNEEGDDDDDDDDDDPFSGLAADDFVGVADEEEDDFSRKSAQGSSGTETTAGTEKREEMGPVSTAVLDVELITELASWRALCPELNCGTTSADLPPSTLSDQQVRNMKEDLVDDGYFQLNPDETPWDDALVDIVGQGIRTLVDNGWHPLWIVLYDEIWLMAHQLSEQLATATGGNRMIMDFFAWCVLQESKTGGREGWPPHRDRCGMTSEEVRNSFRSADQTPKYNTVWIPLTDATPNNSCLYVVPRGVDPTYAPSLRGGCVEAVEVKEQREEFGAEESAAEDTRHPFSRIFHTPALFQHIRALPAPKGSLLAFSHRLMHWGSAGCPKRASRNGGAPRIAFAFGLAQDDYELPPFSRDWLPLPPVQMRMALVAGQLLCYSANEPLTQQEVDTLFTVFLKQAQHFNQVSTG